MTRLYVDWNATTPPAPEVVAAMQRALEHGWANPSSVHGEGRRARAHVEDARDAVAALLGLERREVVLTGGGTEANNLALAQVTAPGGVVLGRVEHPSVTEPAEQLASLGVEVLWVDPDEEGRIAPAAVADALARLTAPPRLVVLQAVNHELGVVQPVAEVAEVAHRAGALLHCDAVQAVGRLPPHAWEGADLVALAGHKLRGPKGIGALATRAGVRLRPLLRGGAQERGVRPGTSDPVAAAGLAAAASRASPERWIPLAPVRDALERGLLARIPGLRVHGARAARAPHVTSASFPGWNGPELVAALDLEGVAVSSGAACSAGTATPSRVVAAVAGAEAAAAAVRFSFGEGHQVADAQRVLAALDAILARTSRNA